MRRLTILVVEDDPVHAAMVAHWLADHRVEIASDATRGAHLAATGVWDLVISDIHMPGPDGLDLLRRIKQHQPHVPVIMVSGHQTVELLAKALEHRADGYLVKPVSGPALLARIEEVLAMARPARPRRVLAIGAHPDDVEIGCGGALLAHRARGDRVHILTLSRGRSGGDDHVRACEAAASAAFLGAQLFLEDLRDTAFGDGGDTIDPIARAIAEVGADVVYTHSASDTHQDHRATHRATRVAARDVATVYAYQSPSTTIEFQPNRFMDISDFVDGKLAAIALYASQAKRSYLAPDLLVSTARYWGRYAGYRLVEPMEVIREASSPG